MPSGGDITTITCNHPTLGTLKFYGKSNADSTYDTGGIRTNDDNNGIDGSGRPIYQQNRQRAMFQVDISWSMGSNYEIENLSALSTSPQDATWTFVNINQVIYKMQGKPVGDIQGNGNTSTITLKVGGYNFQIL